MASVERTNWMQLGSMAIAVIAILLLISRPAHAHDRVEYCGFVIDIPPGWTHEFDNWEGHEILRLKPECWCELEFLVGNFEADKPIRYWYIDRHESPVFLQCGPETADSMSMDGPPEQEMIVGMGPIDGRGWFGFGRHYDFRQYFWGGGNAGADRGFFAIVFGVDGLVLRVSYHEAGHDLRPEDVLTLISHP